MAKTKVIRYTEEEFVTLLENIVKRVKKESINESRTKKTSTKPTKRKVATRKQAPTKRK